jgi:CBS domain-containing membrane protein
LDENQYHGLHRLLVERFDVRGDALYTFVACALACTLSGLAAYLLKQPLLFPSLGPALYLAFETPLAPRASPRNATIGHLVAILAGVLALALFGLLDEPSILREGVTLARVGAAALSVALTGAVLLLLRASHPPAGATTLIVSLGLLQTPPELLALAGGVVIFVFAGWAINRLLGTPAPGWAAREG